MKYRHFISAVLAFFAGTAAFAQNARPQNPMLEQDWAGFDKYAEANSKVTKSPLVVFMGDSITEYWVDQDPAFFSDNDYIGRGISGQTSSKMLARFHRDVIELHPKAVVISCGTNDVAKNNGRITLDNVVTQIMSMVDLARQNDIVPLVVSVPPCDFFFWRREVEHPAGTIIELNRKIKAYCDQAGVPYVDYHSAMAAEDGSMNPEYSKDGCHPVIEGYKVMEKIITPAINRALSSKYAKVWMGEHKGGKVELLPNELGLTTGDLENGVYVPKGTVLRFKASPDAGQAFECGYQAMNGVFAFFTEYHEPEFEVEATGSCSVGASFVDPSFLKGITCRQDIVYAKPGVKPLKYDAFIPDGAKNLPGIVIIHGGAWRMNCEDVMSGMARELARDGKYVVFSIDYRWIGTADGDKTPNTMNQLIEDCYGAILHIQEHAAEYGLDPKNLAVTGDSAGGHLCASVANMIEKVGDGGFGKTPGVYEYLPTYMPAGMSIKQARKNLLAIKAVAPNYGIFDVADIKRFVRDLPEDGQKAVAPIANIPSPKLRQIPTWLNRGTEDTTVSDEANVIYYNALKAAGQSVEYVKVPGAQHAYYDWKPDTATKETFWKYGAPYARRMEDFFNTIFYRK